MVFLSYIGFKTTIGNLMGDDKADKQRKELYRRAFIININGLYGCEVFDIALRFSRVYNVGCK